MLSLVEKLRRFESEPTWLELPLPVEPGSTERESVLVQRLGPSTYLVLSSPGFVEGFAADDVIETSVDPSGFLVVTRGGNIAVRFVLAQESEVPAARRLLDDALSALGGQLDATMGNRGFTYTVPYAGSFEPMEAVLARATALFSSSSWWYGNVYDSEDRPLHWWPVG